MGENLNGDAALLDWPWHFGNFAPAMAGGEVESKPLPCPPSWSEQHDWNLLTPHPFDFHDAPFGAILEPDGYAMMRGRKSRTVKAYREVMPLTTQIASEIFDSLACLDVWGEHRAAKKVAGTVKTDEGFFKPTADVSWMTYTAGKRVLVKTGERAGQTFPMRPMVLLDVIKALASPEHFAIANKDVWDWGQSDRLLRQARIDIDLDYVFDRAHLELLQAQVAQARAVFAAFGLTAEVMRTGNRGIQVLATIPLMPRHLASVIIQMLRYVLKSAALPQWRAKDYQSNLDGLMRLPLGRHAFTGNVAWMLGDDAHVLPVECQARAVHNALSAPSTMSTDWVDEMNEFLSNRFFCPASKLDDGVLPLLAEAMPRNGLVTVLEEACQQFSIPFVVRPTVAAMPAVTTAAEQEVLEDPASAPLRSNIPVDKRRARAIFDAGYKAGESYKYHMIKTADGKRGKNGIGMALVLADGDVEQARRMLHQQAREMPVESEAAVNARISRVDYCLNLDADGLPFNKTYHRLQALLASRKCKNLAGTVMAVETERAIAAAAHLAELRQFSSHRVKTFQPKALTTVQHLLELLQMETRCSEDGTARVSYRTLAAEISSRWPGDATHAMDVSRQMEWVTPTPKCLFHAVDIAEMPASRFEAITYKLSALFYHLPLHPA